DKIIETITVTSNDWSWSFDNLPKYRDGGVEIVYSITEEKVDGYETVVDGYNVTNKHTPATTVVEGTKTWDDANDQDGIRPESITINLLANGEVIETITVTAADWSWKFEDLPKYNAGNEIVYSITEEKVDGYETVVDGYNVTNTHTPETTLVEGAKLWKDANDQDGLRPESITINLLADGTIIDTIVVRESDDWSFSFNDLPKYRDGGIKIVYTITEEKVDGYETTLDGYLVVNTHIPETIILEGTKIWIDNNNQDGIRPTNIKINVLADGATIRTMIVTESDNWSWKLEELPKYRDGGIEIVYTITENAVDGYETTIDGFNITNTHTPSTTSVKVEKIWNDEDNADALRPETITVRLYANGVEIAKKEISSNDNWSCTFDSLAKYINGKEIVYTVSEDAVNGYETTISGTAAEGFVITNTHEVVIPEESTEESIPEESEPAEESPEESIPEESEPVEESPEESIPEESEPVEESPEESIPDESEPVEESPEESIPDESEPVEESPEESIPDESEPVEESPEESIPEESEPVEESPEESIPEESEPVEESPEESIPEESEPVEESPEESIPEESEPVEESPEESIPEESEPVEESPEESIPEESEPVEESPEESIPDESEPVEESPEESIPEESEPEEDDPLLDIYEDDVPLAPPEPPATGDKSITALLIMSITSLLVGSLVASKRRREL
ncbi:MAG: Cna B-type domain-containing protein, partial [Clostridia bacterium]|nr:Cna B-type domain-containing protein [Clostridia bacterium]